jgi:putative aldouronate transport system substrate-binding protein
MAHPYILAGDAIRMSTKMFFNTEVLEKLGYDAIPTTTDGLLEYLRKAKELDYNGNGEADEIPLTASGITAIVGPLAGSFGLYNRGGSHGNIVALEDGTVDYAYRSENYRELLRFLNTLYTEKLLDQDIFTMDFAQLIAKASTGRAVTYCMVNNSPVAGSPYEDFTIGITEPFEGPQGHKFWGTYSLPASTGGAVYHYRCL